MFLSGSGGVRKSHFIKTVYQSISKLLQYHGGSPEKPRVIISAITGVACINTNGTTMHSAFGLPCRGKLYPLDRNTLAFLRNKSSEVQLIIVDEISMVSKRYFTKFTNVSFEVVMGMQCTKFKDLHYLKQLSASI